MKFWQVDAFTGTLFTGNPAAVFVLEKDIPDTLKQQIAAEMNLAETAFVTMGDRPGIRWFTPTVEVDLCGHATLASAHILWTEGFIHAPHIDLDSRSGPLGVSRTGEGYTLDFPAQPATERPDYLPRLTHILGRIPLHACSNGEDCVAVMADPDFVRGLAPDLAGIAGLAERGLLVTAAGDGDPDYVYRCFFPKLGIDEDPVTGSANTALAPLWAERLGRTVLSARQVSKRGGTLHLEVTGGRVLITGQAVTVFSAEMPLPGV